LIESRVDLGFKFVLRMGGVVFLSLLLEEVLILCDFILKLLINIGLFDDDIIDVDIRVKLMVFNESFYFKLNSVSKLVDSFFFMVVEIGIVLRSGEFLVIGAIVFVQDGFIMRRLCRRVIVWLDLTAISLPREFSLEGLLRTLMEIVFPQVEFGQRIRCFTIFHSYYSDRFIHFK
jgi:hypothetical protein